MLRKIGQHLHGLGLQLYFTVAVENRVQVRLDDPDTNTNITFQPRHASLLAPTTKTK